MACSKIEPFLKFEIGDNTTNTYLKASDAGFGSRIQAAGESNCTDRSRLAVTSWSFQVGHFCRSLRQTKPNPLRSKATVLYSL